MNPLPTTSASAGQPHKDALLTRRLAVITIGQSPRTDLTPDLQRWLPGVRLVERGALDHLSPDQIAGLAPRAGERVLTTRLRDGSSVIIGHDFADELVQQAIVAVESADPDHQPAVDAVLLACTGEFPPLRHRTPLFHPDAMLTHAVGALARGMQCVGVICPLPEQMEETVIKFAPVADRDTQVEVRAATPYSDARAGLVEAGQELASAGAELIALDCIGYSDAMRRLVADTSGVPTVIGRAAAARLVGEALESLPRRGSEN
ncbi:hypothetical protein GCM10011575_45940 [Microlunatus endophyticus]|uniref:Protein AroM n=1 Tax=Microlunatus endophyticus TaxID=1716077 RepID=A0A917W9U4_9ACTN|nr:AroM family protein [Microlunatus endophyticus]GGL82495.1 hypothetical protein GCM10011575_45940 [Microlunatus endophyticus]